MSEQELENHFNAILAAAVTLNSQFILNRGDAGAKNFKEAQDRLNSICTERDLKATYIRDGEDLVLLIQTQDKELIVQLIMNFQNYESGEE